MLKSLALLLSPSFTEKPPKNLSLLGEKQLRKKIHNNFLNDLEIPAGINYLKVRCIDA
jgi:hypothetical protein